MAEWYYVHTKHEENWVTYNTDVLNLLKLFMSMGWDHVSELRAETGLLFIPQVMYANDYSVMILTGENRRTRRKTCPSTTLSTTNPIWTDRGAKQGLRHLSHAHSWMRINGRDKEIGRYNGNGKQHVSKWRHKVKQSRYTPWRRLGGEEV
jgi:hypothetical protein